MKNNNTLLKKLKSFTRKTDNVEYCLVLADFLGIFGKHLIFKEEELEKIIGLLRLEKNADESEIAYVIFSAIFIINDELESCKNYKLRENLNTTLKLFTCIKEILENCISKSLLKQYEIVFGKRISLKEMLSITKQINDKYLRFRIDVTIKEFNVA